MGLLVLLGAWALLSPSTALTQLDAIIGSPWFPLALVGLYLIRGILGWPVTLLSGLVGFRYGVVLGLPLALLGAIGTTALTWALTRRLPTESGLIGRVASGGDRYFQTAGDIRGVTAARLAPTPAAAVSAAAGVAGVPLRAFVVGTLFGVLPWTVAAVTVGASLDSVAAAGRIGPDPVLVFGLSLAAVLLLARPAYRSARSRGWIGS